MRRKILDPARNLQCGLPFGEGSSPGFLRLTREGDVVRAYYKAAPADAWMLIGSQTFPLLPATVRIGFAVSSHLDGTLATGYFDNLTLVQ